eukprot:1478296-Prorocentrum_lima.AAC.1
MPPVESLEILISHIMTDQVDDEGQPLCLGVWDVSRAHFYGTCQREIYTNIPEELAREVA